MSLRDCQMRPKSENEVKKKIPPTHPIFSQFPTESQALNISAKGCRDQQPENIAPRPIPSETAVQIQLFGANKS